MLTETTALYLDAIASGVTRCRKLARALDVAPTTVTVTLRRLTRYGLAVYRDGEATLTPAGSEAVWALRQTVSTLSKTLGDLGLSAEKARAQAWRWAATTDPETTAALALC